MAWCRADDSGLSSLKYWTVTPSRGVAPDIGVRAAGWLLVLQMRPLFATAAGERAQDLNSSTEVRPARQALDAPPGACSEARAKHASTQARVELEDRGQLHCVWLAPMVLEVHAPMEQDWSRVKGNVACLLR